MYKINNLMYSIKLLIITLLVATIVSILFFSVRTNAQSPSTDNMEKYFSNHLIEDGDNLWTIAECYLNNPTEKEIKKYVKNVMEINQLKNEVIKKGQYIIIYYYK